MGRLSFETPDMTRFPGLALGYAAARAGGTMPAVLNAANEMAVAAFLDGRLGFMDIPKTVEATMEAHRQEALTSATTYFSRDLQPPAAAAGAKPATTAAAR